jgi:7-cyano-7-deazaguanine synthase in queuosine biosynthesis
VGCAVRVICLSGGLDSAVALLSEPAAYDLALSFDYGQPRAGHVEPPELTAARRLAKRAGVPHEIAAVQFEAALSAGLLGGNVATAVDSVVPGRNALFVSLCAMRGATTVTLGCNADDQSAYVDCRADVLRAVGVACGVDVSLPLVRLHKTQIRDLAAGHQLGTGDTVTCYRGTGCGVCAACALMAQP